MIAQAVIARCPAKHVAQLGTFVVTTERALFVVDDQIVWETRRDAIDHVSQVFKMLYISVERARPGIGLEMASPTAGPMPWSWYFQPPRPRTDRDPGHGDPDDRMIGPVDDRRRVALDNWQQMMGMVTVPAAEHYLDDLPEDPFAWEDIVEIVYAADGRGDGPHWLLVVRLADGRWVYFQHQVDITGEIYSTTIVAASLESLWWGAMTELDRDRVTAQMTQERVDEELVRLDQILEQTSEPYPQTHVERRMLAIKKLR